MQTLYLILTVAVLVLNLVITRLDWQKISNSLQDGKVSCDLLIAVLSSRENFEQRETIRKTWLSDEESGVRYFFVVGQRPCLIPIDDRTDIYNCQQPDIDVGGSKGDVHYLSKTKQTLSYGPIYTTMRFKVHHDVLLSKVGISLSKLKGDKRAVVALIEATSHLVKAEFKSANGEGNFVVVDGFAYRPVETVILPKGFEGVLHVESNSSDEEYGWESVLETDDGGGVIIIEMVESGLSVPHPFSHRVHLAVSMAFTIYNSHVPVEHEKERKEAWLRHVDQISDRLWMEMDKHGDIELVDVIDVYRHLPGKLLAAAATAVDRYRFHFLLKADDDTFVHLPRLRHFLKTQLPSNVKKLWSGRFRCNWMVQRTGKWKETTYSPAVYPCFACGSANLLSYDLVDWLANNRPHLHAFQGEDVSLGIWLSGVAPILQQDDRWHCDDGCDTNAFTRGQLNVSQMTQMWSCLRHQNQFCCQS